MGTGSATEGGQSLIRTVPAGVCPHFHDLIVVSSPYIYKPSLSIPNHLPVQNNLKSSFDLPALGVLRIFTIFN